MTRKPLFDQHSEAVLAAIKAGATLPDAAREAGVSHPTIRGWVTRGHKDPTSKYGGFAAGVDAALTKRKLPENTDLPADREELLVLVSRAARAGSVTAMRLLSELLTEPDQDTGDELAAFEVLTRRRPM